MLTKDQQNIVIETLKEHGTYTQAANKAGVRRNRLFEERQRNKTFGKKCDEAINQGKQSVGDSALTVIEGLAFGKDTDDKVRLTAALSLANAFIPNFKGTSHSEHKETRDVRIMTSIPRPNYSKVDVVDSPEVKELPPASTRIGDILSHNDYLKQYRKKKKEEQLAKRGEGEDKNRKANAEKPISLQPLEFDEAVSDLLKVKPEDSISCLKGGSQR